MFHGSSPTSGRVSRQPAVAFWRSIVASTPVTLKPTSTKLLVSQSRYYHEYSLSNRAQRDIAWEIFPWPCIGEFWFITLGLLLHPSYTTVLDRLCSTTPAPRLLDLGTCLGQDLRQLVADGAPQANLYGADLFSEYESVGHQLFRDADRFTNRFITADLLDDSDDGPLARTGGTWDMVNIIMFLHIWDHSTQVAASKRILKLLKKQAGSMIIGAQTGSTEPGELVLKPPYVAAGEERSIYRHSVETFSDMWKEIEKQSDVKMEIKAMYDEPEAREILAKEEESGERKFFFKRSAEQRKLFFTIELL